MITKADWRQTVQAVLDLIQDVDTFNAACSTPCEHFRLNPLEMLLVLDVLHNAHTTNHWPDMDAETQSALTSIQNAMPRYGEYALWLGKLPGRNYPTVVRRLTRVQADFTQHCDRAALTGTPL